MNLRPQRAGEPFTHTTNHAQRSDDAFVDPRPTIEATGAAVDVKPPYRQENAHTDTTSPKRIMETTTLNPEAIRAQQPLNSKAVGWIADHNSGRPYAQKRFFGKYCKRLAADQKPETMLSFQISTSTSHSSGRQTATHLCKPPEATNDRWRHQTYTVRP